MQILRRHNELLRPLFLKDNGREIKTIGDAFLVEFDSALDAVQCAIEIQTALRKLNGEPSISEDNKIRIRIGVHLGDVIHSDNDVFGDAVNIASRIQPLAGPEGICVSEQVFHQVGNKISLEFQRVEERSAEERYLSGWSLQSYSPVDSEGGAGRSISRPRNHRSSKETTCRTPTFEHRT